MSGVYQGTSATDHRRKWDTAEYEVKARERINNEREAELIRTGKKKKDEPIVKKELLQARDYQVDLESKVGKSVVINKTTPSAESGGFYCEICDCNLKDSINFLDHINGKNHQRNMGMSMKLKRSTVDDVRARFAIKKIEKEREQKMKRYEDQLEDVREEEARMCDAKKDKKKDIRKRKAEPSSTVDLEGDLDPELQAMMGFGGFGGAKK